MPSRCVQRRKLSQIVNKIVSQVRLNLGVPDRADDDVEAEFVASRQRLDAYYSEFRAIWSSELFDRLCPERLQAMLGGLSSRAAQRYLEATQPTQRNLTESAR